MNSAQINTSSISSSPNSPNRFVSPAIVMLGAFMFSSKGIFVKMMYAEGLTPTGVLALRMAVALPFYLVTMLLLGRELFTIRSKDWFAIMALSFIGYFLCSLINFIELQFISIGLERVILFSHPSLVLIGSAVFQKRPPSRTLVLASVMSWFGLYLVIREEIQIGDHPQWIMIGSGLIFLSATIYASYILIAKPIIMRIGASRYTSIVMCFSCAFILINFGIVDGDVGSLFTSEKALVYGVVIGIFGTVVPTYILSYGLSKIPSTSYAVISSAGPVATILLSLVMIGVLPSTPQMIGITLSIAGSLLASLNRD
jgi:drug/metabolite transporter (DMT)-like permease